MQLDIFGANLHETSRSYDLCSLLSELKSMSHVQRLWLEQVCTVASLILIMPATNTASERSFSSLRIVKPYLRSTISQVRLNSIMTLHIHKELTDKLDLLEIGNDFVGASNHRQHTLGKFIPIDQV